jgi:Asp-tRNA(Asn)/Glu-tRNA(Gln) amidotransferase A subunit family amidase
MAARRKILEARSAVDQVAAIAAGEAGVTDALEACLERIGAVEPEVRAFAFLDPDHARIEAELLERQRRAGRPIGPLHGLPVGVKDIIDVRGMPAENGTVLDDGRRPGADAALIRALKAAGSLVLGKTRTTELAYYAPTVTRNPHDPARTPGGSSSGSAAAVASGMVPVAIGTQTNGSVIRPASFCGVVGFKPSFGMIPRTGVLTQAAPLDTIGVFARSTADAALLADVLIGDDPGDPATSPRARQGLPAAATAEPPLPPLFAFVRSPFWDQAEDDTKAAFEELAALLGEQCDPVDLPAPFAKVHEWHGRIMQAGFAHNLRAYAERGWAQLSPQMQRAIEAGRQVTAPDYLDAVAWIERLNGGLDALFERYDAILTPAAPGVAPLSLESTGNPAFCTLWTFAGTPAISLPLLRGGTGLPLGVQLVARRGDDARLIRTAAWLERFIADADAGGTA